jgi:general secretion pathway protein D
VISIFPSLSRVCPRPLGGALLLLLGTLSLTAQDEPPAFPEGPPSFIPSAPPGPPPSLPPQFTQGNRTVVPPPNPTTRTPPPPPRGAPPAPTRFNLSELAEQPPPPGAPGIFDPSAPAMQRPFDEAGIVLVELGTNEVLTLLQSLVDKPILRQQNLPAVKITFDKGSKQLTVGQMVRALESLLALNGIALTTVGEDFIKAVPAAIINTQVPVLWEGTTLGAIPTQMIYEKVFRLDFLTPQEAIPLIQPIMSQGAPLALEKSGIILVTDALINLQRIERLLATIDAPSELGTEVLFFQLQNVEAQQVLRRLQQIQSGPLRRRLENNTSFDADDRTNQLIIFTHRSNRPIFEDLIEKMDIDVAPLTTTKVYSIRYAEATEIVSIIDQVISGQKQVRDNQSAAQNAAAARRAAQQQAQQQAANVAAAALRADSSNLQFSDFLTLVPDERANSIVASGTASDLRALDALIEQIDVLLAQVRIEAVIVEVTLNKNDASGIDSLGFTYSQTSGADAKIIRTIPAFSLGGISAEGDGIIWDSDGNLDFSLLVSAVASKSNVQILSAPTIVTTHNREAKISVGERRPIITGTSTSATTEFRSSQVQFQNIGIELSVTPLIGSNDVIQLEIEQSVEDIGGTVRVDTNEQPIITSRQASSFVSVGNGQLVVLGGLQRVDADETRSKFPILGHLPLLDRIFTRTTETSTRREVILFVRPHIIRTAAEADAMTREQINRLSNREAVNDYLDTGEAKSFEQPSEPTQDSERERPPRRIFGPGR